jgi:hypothetical protein
MAAHVVCKHIYTHLNIYISNPTKVVLLHGPCHQVRCIIHIRAPGFLSPDIRLISEDERRRYISIHSLRSVKDPARCARLQFNCPIVNELEDSNNKGAQHVKLSLGL